MKKDGEIWPGPLIRVRPFVKPDRLLVENAIQAATAKHNRFLKELGQPLLPGL